MSVRVGDRVVAAAASTNTSPREGTVEAIVRHDPLRVAIRWDDGHSSILAPADGSTYIIESAPSGASRKRRASTR